MRSISRGGRALAVTLGLVAVLGSAACDNIVDDGLINTPTQPTTTTTDTFSGSITVNGAATHPFVVNFGGNVTATLTSIAPEGTVAGLSLGTWNGANCALVITRDDAAQGNAVIGTASSPGTLCVRIQDNGKLTTAAEYTITVVHF